jgi:hypothetical protein
MSKTAARRAHQNLIARINAAATSAELAAILDTVTMFDEPGLPLDLPDGHYHDGAFLATFRGGEYVTTMTRGRPAGPLNDRVWDLWSEVEAARLAARDAERDGEQAAADAARRGRPEIGRPVQIRFPEWLLASVDRWADAHDMTRAEAMRKLVLAGKEALDKAEAIDRLFPSDDK